jgi:hypothetical protein
MERNGREVKGKLKGHYQDAPNPITGNGLQQDYCPFNFPLTSFYFPLTSI